MCKFNDEYDKEYGRPEWGPRPPEREFGREFGGPKGPRPPEGEFGRGPGGPRGPRPPEGEFGRGPGGPRGPRPPEGEFGRDPGGPRGPRPPEGEFGRDPGGPRGPRPSEGEFGRGPGGPRGPRPSEGEFGREFGGPWGPRPPMGGPGMPPPPEWEGIAYEDLTTEEKLEVSLHKLARRRPARRVGGQGGILAILNVTGSMPQRQLQDILGIAAGSISETVGKLERAGLVTKEISDGDRRKTVVTITDAGRQAAAKAAMSEPEARFASLTDEEKQTLLSLLEKLNEEE